MTMIIHTVQSHDGIALLSCTIISMTALTLTAATDIHGTPARWNQNKCHVNILWLISILWYKCRQSSKSTDITVQLYAACFTILLGTCKAS